MDIRVNYHRIFRCKVELYMYCNKFIRKVVLVEPIVNET